MAQFLKSAMSIFITIIESHTSKSNSGCSELHSEQAHLHFMTDNWTIVWTQLIVSNVWNLNSVLPLQEHYSIELQAEIIMVFVFIYFHPDDLLIVAESYLMLKESKRSV